MATGPILEGAFLITVEGGVIIEENYLEGTEPSIYSTRGFYLNNTQGTDLRDNTVVNFECGLIAYLGSTDNLIRFNDLSGNSGSVGLAVDSVDNTFYGNLPDPLTVCSGGAPAPVQLSAYDLIGLCIESVESLGLERGIAISLLTKLEVALKSCESGNDNASAGQLGAFINAVEAQQGKKISDEDVTLLLRCAIDAIRLL